MVDIPPPNYEQTIEAIAQCGISSASISIKYQDYLQSDEVTISDIGAISDDKLRCLKSAVHPFYVLNIEDIAQRAAFYEFSEREDRPKMRAAARDWLSSNGWLDRIPKFDPTQGVEVFAVALEQACGLEPGSTIKPNGPSTLQVQPGISFDPVSETSTKSLHCLAQMIAASNADEYGVSLGFVGNEASSASDDE